MSPIRFDHDIPKELLSSAHLRGRLLSELQKVAKKAKDYAENTVKDFENVEVEFVSDVRYAGGSVEVSIGTDSDIYKFLDEGTDERWAVMNSPFNSKTQPGTIQTTVGYRTYTNGYYTAIRGRNAMLKRNIPARPGIVAREFSSQIEDFLDDEFFNAIDGVLNEEF